MKRLFRFLSVKLPRRLRAAFTIILGRKQSWLLLTIHDKEDLVKLILRKDFEMELTYEGLQPYLIDVMFKTVGGMVDETDLILGKAKFEAQAEEYLGESIDLDD